MAFARVGLLVGLASRRREGGGGVTNTVRLTVVGVTLAVLLGSAAAAQGAAVFQSWVARISGAGTWWNGMIVLNDGREERRKVLLIKTHPFAKTAPAWAARARHTAVSLGWTKLDIDLLLRLYRSAQITPMPRGQDGGSVEDEKGARRPRFGATAVAMK